MTEYSVIIKILLGSLRVNKSIDNSLFDLGIVRN